MLPLVSVLVNTYNHERFIAQAVQSVLDQDFPADQMEIVVVDDGSTDGTPQALEPFLSRIRYIRKSNGGQISAFNVAVAESRAEIVAFLDGDDWWPSGKLRAVLDAFAKDSSITAVGHGFTRVHEQARTQESCVPAETYRLSLRNPDAARFAYSGRPFLSTSKLAVRRRVLEVAGRLPDNLIFFDVPVQLFAMALGDALILSQPLCFYRLHGENLYETRHPDAKNLRRRFEFISAQLDFLPGALMAAGVSRETVDALFEADEIARDQMRLVLQNGWPWETFNLERRRFRFAYTQHSAPYRLFKSLVLASTLLMSPRRFYFLRDWYAARNLRRLRKPLGEPVPIPGIQIQ